MKRCLLCNSMMVWQNDFDLQDVGIDAEGISVFLYCSECDSLHRFDEYDDGHKVLLYLKEVD